MAIDPGRVTPYATDVPIAEVLDGLNDLLRLDHDAISAYEIAIDALRNRDHALQIEGFKRDHEAHIRRLNDLIIHHGGTPANEPHATAPLKEAMQKLGGAGGDRGLLVAWRANELQAMTKYDRYAHKAARWPADAKRVVDENALDEERHYDWVIGLLGVDDPAEVQFANSVRERMVTAREARDSAAERASATAVKVRSYAAYWLDPDGDFQLALAGEIRDHLLRSVLVAFSFGFVVGRVIR
jgi:rubrerythrin